MADKFKPDYERWRHGGWYTDTQYPSGGCGCVSNNFPDKRWRIIDAGGASDDVSFSSRDDAAKAVHYAVGLAKQESAALLKSCRDAMAFIERHKAGLIGTECTAEEYEAAIKPLCQLVLR